MTDWNERNREIIAEFRANNGRVGGSFANSDLLLLHTTGAKSGLPRINPLVTTEDNGRMVIIASKGGAPDNPDWYYNAVANPQVEVEYGRGRFAALAEEIAEPERSRLYAKMAARYPFFARYAQQTERTIPLLTLTLTGPRKS